MTQVSDKNYAGGNLLYRYSSRKFTEGIKVVLTSIMFWPSQAVFEFLFKVSIIFRVVIESALGQR